MNVIVYFMKKRGFTRRRWLGDSLIMIMLLRFYDLMIGLFEMVWVMVIDEHVLTSSGLDFRVLMGF